jgi:hypothetical protein
VKPLSSALVSVEPLTEAAVSVVVHAHGAELRPFAGLLARFGKAAARDVQMLHQVLSANTAVLTDGAIGQGWAAVKRLAEQARTLPAGPERTLAAIEVERAMQALLSRETDFVIAYTDALEHAAAELRQAKAQQALKAAKGLLSAVTPTAASQVLAHLAKELDAGAPALKRLWQRYRSVPGGPAGMLKAAGIAGERAQPMQAILRRRGLGVAQRQSQLWGHLSKIRGELGEGYALGNKVWFTHRADQLARARGLANRLGPGHTVEYLTQAEHGLRLNGAEGPDAIVAIVNRAEKRLYDTMRAQVKVAEIGEGAAQSANDVLRSIGQERRGAQALSRYEFRLTPSGPAEAFALSSRPEVTTHLYLINAAGGRTPARDLAELKALGLPITTIALDMSVTQFTHLAVSMAESAIKLLKAAP